MGCDEQDSTEFASEKRTSSGSQSSVKVADLSSKVGRILEFLESSQPKPPTVAGGRADELPMGGETLGGNELTSSELITAKNEEVRSAETSFNVPNTIPTIEAWKHLPRQDIDANVLVFSWQNPNTRFNIMEERPKFYYFFPICHNAGRCWILPNNSTKCQAFSLGPT